MAALRRPITTEQQLTAAVTPSEFHHTITKRAVAQILRSTGFKTAKSSALETLTRIATLFLQSLTTSAASHAASCHRTHSNLFDVVHAIEHFSLSFGFSGASDFNQPLLKSKTLENLRHFFDTIAGPPLRFIPRHRFRNSDSSAIFPANILSKDDKRGPEIPKWLPEFPAFETNDGSVKGGGKEVLWEEKRVEGHPLLTVKLQKGKKENSLQGRRERVKFRLKGKRRNSAKMGVLDDLELRTGVCRGGKRVCLIEKVNNMSSLFQDDDEKCFNIGL